MPPILSELQKFSEVIEIYSSSIFHQSTHRLSGRPFTRAEHSFETLETSLRSAQQSQDMQGQLRIISLIATTEGRYDFTAPDLNGLVPFTPIPFQLWLRQAWAGQLAPT